MYSNTILVVCMLIDKMYFLKSCVLRIFIGRTFLSHSALMGCVLTEYIPFNPVLFGCQLVKCCLSQSVRFYSLLADCILSHSVFLYDYRQHVIYHLLCYLYV